ncbi:DNA helicase-2 / ATP-dependent DNA helicase PcrA [Monaibacterium marinum]|uniref:DNA 3'-5' helicase n=1 Tax=Pontivivens marinum TaxID=1690039 RepID=A0A2C9CNY1_9RHOB|nr:UvrD-helicase domain-containing protein [Monaibacterium marinum]SOH92895.1 DNA helicase-2 / ATP-dependent DNA helicase PcrA [Monaibacterium marinum]
MNDFDDDPFESYERESLSARAMAARPAPYLNDLNAAQRQAVETMDGPVLMLAGAGTGKTKALTTRIAHLMNTGRAQPNEILAVTFTNKAAREMKTRVGSHVGGIVEGMPWLGTFHSLCNRLLRRHAELVDLKSNFTILDMDDQLRLLKQIIRAHGLDEKRWPPRMLSGIIDAWKNRGWTWDKLPTSEHGAYNHRGAELYEEYQKRLITLNAVDFGDLLLHVVTIFQRYPDVLEKYQRWFKYILVDEYQDTNVAQYLWLRLLAQGHKNICCVGDDDQSIYGWRGAEVGNILKFEKDFPGATVIRLEQNYRSTEHILAAASGVIAGNADRLGKTLWTADTGGEKVRLIGHWDGDEEARWIGEEIENYQRGTRGLDPIGLNNQAILVRASFQMRAFEDRFLTLGMPYRVIGGPRFYERLESRDAMAYFRVVISQDDDLAFERIINTPKRGLGDKALATINGFARENGVSMMDAARTVVADGGIKGKGGKNLAELIRNLDRWRAIMAWSAKPGPQSDDVIDLDEPMVAQPDGLDAPLTHVELAQVILDESGYTAHWQNDKTPEAPGRLENLKELVRALEEFENLQGFLEHVALVMSNDTEDAAEKVTIMTLHGAKGLEFPVIFLPGWEDGLFPSQRSMDESGLKGLEEERRLAYVGITRAERHCTISFVANRMTYGQWNSAMPSRFIDELPEEHVEVLTPPGLYGGGFGAAASASPREQAMQGSDLMDKAAKADVYNSPGWARMQRNTARRGTRAPSEARNMTIDATAMPAFAIGERVFHQKFGYGTVDAMEGDKLTVAFEKAGTKKVLASYLSASDDVPF